MTNLIHYMDSEYTGRPSKRRKPIEPDADPLPPACLSSADSSTSADDNDSDTLADPQTPITPASPTREYSSRPKVYSCPYENCHKAFNRPVRLEEHIRSHTNTRSFLCPHSPCFKAFLRQTHLNHHIKSAHTNIRSFACVWPGCTKKFVTGQRLRRHIASHDGKEKYRCTGFAPCNQSFRKHSTLQKHVDVEHFHRKPFRCNNIDSTTGKECEHGYDTANKLNAHISRYHSGKPQYWCQICPSITSSIDESSGSAEPTGFTTYAELQEHIRGAHPPICTSCNLACSSRRELDRHIEITHSDATLSSRRKFPCTQPLCDKSFTKRGNLNIHLRTVHAPIKPFTCGAFDLSKSKDTAIAAWDATDACGASFTSKAWLQKHVRTQHLKSANMEPANSTLNKPSVLSRLTGNDYHQESINMIACPLSPACELVFERYRDVEEHAIAKHSMDSVEIAEVLAEREALSGGVFWLGGCDAEEEVEHYHSIPKSQNCAIEGGDFVPVEIDPLIDPLLKYVRPEGDC